MLERRAEKNLPDQSRKQVTAAALAVFLARPQAEDQIGAWLGVGVKLLVRLTPGSSASREVT